MREPKLMLDLLHKMANDPGGRFRLSMSEYRSIEEYMRFRHHCYLLVEANHAVWDGGSLPDGKFVRISNDGYDFLNAVDQGEEHKEKFLSLFGRGMDYVRAANEVIKLVGNISAS